MNQSYFPFWGEASVKPSVDRPEDTSAGAVITDPMFWVQFGHDIARKGIALGQSFARTMPPPSHPQTHRSRAVPAEDIAFEALASTLPSARALDDDGYNPVVFVHGFAGHSRQFAPMRGFFRKGGRARTYGVSYPSNGAIDIATLASRLAMFVDSVANVNGLPSDAKVDVVAHSLGGLIVRLAIEDARVARRIGTIVTLGTPHSGTRAAHYATSPLAAELQSQSETVRRLNAQLPWAGPPLRPRLVSLWSRSDMFVIPPVSACVDGAENVEMPRFQHTDYLSNETGIRRTFEILQPPETRLLPAVK